MSFRLIASFFSLFILTLLFPSPSHANGTFLCFCDGYMGESGNCETGWEIDEDSCDTGFKPATNMCISACSLDPNCRNFDGQNNFVEASCVDENIEPTILNYDQPCGILPNTECINGTSCQATSEGNRCIYQNQSIGDQCRYSEECVSGVAFQEIDCENSVCTCVKNCGTGTTPSRGEPCGGPNATCTNGTECKDVPDEGKICVRGPNIPLGGRCYADFECINGTCGDDGCCGSCSARRNLVMERFCGQVGSVDSSEYVKCETCFVAGEGVWTSLGCIKRNANQVVNFFINFVISVAGAIALLLMAHSGFLLSISRGNPEKLEQSRQRFISAVIGLTMVILSLVLLQFIGVELLRLPNLS